jgi:uncharacterized protein YbbC (DUF1343 family)
MSTIAEINMQQMRIPLSERIPFNVPGCFMVLVPVCLSFLLSCSLSRGQEDILTGAERTELYLPMLSGRNIGMVANQTSVIGNTHLVDSMVSIREGELMIRKVFSPEHGFRGEAEAGQIIEDRVDAQTGLPLISLYGKDRKPSKEALSDLDLIIFDIQDVGARFYTYISTLFYVMQACAENGKDLILLDRPNPNGFYVDGPVLDTTYRSFVGMHEVPVVHGMTMGEYARMINGEGWLGDDLACRLEVVPCLHYDHSMRYILPVSPSPNLPNMNAIYLYPSTCFFEGTVISEGRGTDFPFEVFGHPQLENCHFAFTPVSIPGKSADPKLKGETCMGVDLRYLRNSRQRDPEINLSWLLFAYENYPEKEAFFIPYFEQLAGTADLRRQIMDGMTADEIRSSWSEDLEAFRKIREKYLLYPDFE